MKKLFYMLLTTFLFVSIALVPCYAETTPFAPETNRIQTFNKANPQDIVFKINTEAGYTCYGQPKINGSAVVGSQNNIDSFIIPRTYLSQMPNGEYPIWIQVMRDGQAIVPVIGENCIVKVTGSPLQPIISPRSASFIYEYPKDLVFDLHNVIDVTKISLYGDGSKIEDLGLSKFSYNGNKLIIPFSIVCNWYSACYHNSYTPGTFIIKINDDDNITANIELLGGPQPVIDPINTVYDKSEREYLRFKLINIGVISKIELIEERSKKIIIPADDPSELGFIGMDDTAYILLDNISTGSYIIRFNGREDLVANIEIIDGESSESGVGGGGCNEGFGILILLLVAPIMLRKKQ